MHGILSLVQTALYSGWPENRDLPPRTCRRTVQYKMPSER
ncbi:hypothetical protein NEICINOT_03928 [Neisseria cinerea ATCC 14685]|uniref:Uncharacterized protein n=1 Tax=Neisseria cinerea ATCC 14685 TaxID=546262 RepID=D0W2P4_NEICI|nr:hypothetical protein NEICINOT_03928 [Neisseria cinerea ATCC 14685]